jgi:hypothetical protein
MMFLYYISIVDTVGPELEYFPIATPLGRTCQIILPLLNLGDVKTEDYLNNMPHRISNHFDFATIES